MFQGSDVFWQSADYFHARMLLFLFSLSHIILVSFFVICDIHISKLDFDPAKVELMTKIGPLLLILEYCKSTKFCDFNKLKCANYVVELALQFRGQVKF